jgi:hypothetical protein
MRVVLALVAVLAVLSVSQVKATEAYNSTFSAEMLHFAGAAYCPGNVVENWSCSFCSEVKGFQMYGVVYNSSTDMLSYVGYRADTDAIVVAFRGTSPLSILDWVTDLNFFQVGAVCPGCEIHEGFLGAYLSVRDETVALVKEIVTQYPESQVVITGHSLGGALTHLASVDLATNEGITADTIYSFGAPRVGNKVFVDTAERLFHNSTTYRVTHGLDPVPHVPPRLWDFYHPPTEVYYDGLNTGYKVCDGSGEDPTCADQWLIALGVTDHVTYLGLDFMAQFLKCNL